MQICCEMVAIIWLRQSGYIIDTLHREIRTPDASFVRAEDEKVAEWLVKHECYLRRSQ